MLGFTIQSPCYPGGTFHAKHCLETEHGLASMLLDSPIGGSIGSTDHVIQYPSHWHQNAMDEQAVCVTDVFKLTALAICLGAKIMHKESTLLQSHL